MVFWPACGYRPVGARWEGNESGVIIILLDRNDDYARQHLLQLLNIDSLLSYPTSALHEVRRFQLVAPDNDNTMGLFSRAQGPLRSLPVEILCHILDRMEMKDLLACSLVSFQAARIVLVLIPR